MHRAINADAGERARVRERLLQGANVARQPRVTEQEINAKAQRTSYHSSARSAVASSPSEALTSRLKLGCCCISNPEQDRGREFAG